MSPLGKCPGCGAWCETSSELHRSSGPLTVAHFAVVRRDEGGYAVEWSGFECPGSYLPPSRVRTDAPRKVDRMESA